jgi:hypothetical protein
LSTELEKKILLDKKKVGDLISYDNMNRHENIGQNPQRLG